MNRRVVIVVLIFSVSLVSIAYPVVNAQYNSLESESPPPDSLETTESELEIYEYSEDDHDAKFYVGVQNNHNQTVKAKAELTPVLNTGKELDTHTKTKTLDSGEVGEFHTKWNSYSDKESRIEKIKVDTYVCSNDFLVENCTKVVQHGG